jgi:hypothetical protein
MAAAFHLPARRSDRRVITHSARKRSALVARR